MTAEAPVNNFFERAAFTIFFIFPAPTPVDIIPKTELNIIAPARYSSSLPSASKRPGNASISFLSFLSLSSKSSTAGLIFLPTPLIKLTVPRTMEMIGNEITLRTLNIFLNNGIAFITRKPIPPINPPSNNDSKPPPFLCFGSWVGSKFVPSSSFLFSRVFSFDRLLNLSACSLNIPALTFDKTNLSLNVSSIFFKSFFITRIFIAIFNDGALLFSVVL